MLTTPHEARRFVDTGIDWLAPAFGNVHGNYGPRGIQLEYDRLDAINKAVGKDVRLVLHGAGPIYRGDLPEMHRARREQDQYQQGHEQ